MAFTTLALVICAATTIFACYASFKKMRAKYSESALFLFIFMAAYAVSMTLGAWLHLTSGGTVTPQNAGEMAALCKMFGMPMNMLGSFLGIITLGVAFINMVLGAIILWTRRPITYCLAFVIAVMALASLAGGVLFGVDPFSMFFMACCGVMAYFAWVLHLTYAEFCVIGNNYIQAAVCALAALAPLLVCIRKKKGFLRTGFCAMNASAHLLFFLVVAVHYWMPLQQSFNQCVQELVWLASVTGTTYVIVNLVIYVILFIFDLLANALLYRLVR